MLVPDSPSDAWIFPAFFRTHLPVPWIALDIIWTSKYIQTIVIRFFQIYIQNRNIWIHITIWKYYLPFFQSASSSHPTDDTFFYQKGELMQQSTHCGGLCQTIKHTTAVTDARLSISYSLCYYFLHCLTEQENNNCCYSECCSCSSAQKGDWWPHSNHVSTQHGVGSWLVA